MNSVSNVCRTLLAWAPLLAAQAPPANVDGSAYIYFRPAPDDACARTSGRIFLRKDAADPASVTIRQVEIAEKLSFPAPRSIAIRSSNGEVGPFPCVPATRTDTYCSSGPLILNTSNPQHKIALLAISAGQAEIVVARQTGSACTYSLLVEASILPQVAAIVPLGGGPGEVVPRGELTLDFSPQGCRPTISAQWKPSVETDYTDEPSAIWLKVGNATCEYRNSAGPTLTLMGSPIQEPHGPHHGESKATIERVVFRRRTGSTESEIVVLGARP